MQLESVGLKRFKSLYDVHVPFEKFNLLTGPNGSGKSNFVTALDFLGETYLYGLEYAVSRFGGIDSIAYRRTRRTTVPVTFSVRARLDRFDARFATSPRLMRTELRPDEYIWFEHTFSVRPSQALGDSTFVVSGELINLGLGSNEGEIPFISISLERGEKTEIEVLEAPDVPGRFKDLIAFRLFRSESLADYLHESVSPTELLVSGLNSLQIVREFRNALSYIKVYRLNSASCRTVGVLTPNAALERDGSNLPGVIARMRRPPRGARKPRSEWDVLVSAMAEMFPGLQNIDAGANSAGGLELLFYEEGVGRPWSSSQVSDGTIQYLALLAVLLDRRSSVLFVEEPENALHSWMLRNFLELCRSSERGQVLITSHSPVALKSAAPAEVMLAWRRNGRTSIQRLVEVDADAERLYMEEGIDLFEQYDSGFLPQTLPHGRI